VAGFVEYCRLNNNTTDTFSWVPVTDGPTFSGSCVVTAVEIGGDVGTQLTTDFEFVVTGALVRTEHV